MELKKLIYRTLWVAIGVLTSCIVVGTMEIALIMNGIKVDWVVFLAFIAIILLGLLLGVLCGRLAWEKVYVKGLRGVKYTLEHDVRIKQFESDLYKELKGFDIDRAMKWTVTIFLIFVMLLMAVGVTFRVFAFAHRFLDTDSSYSELVLTD